MNRRPTPDEQEFELSLVDSLHVVLARSSDPDNEWLWCIFCERYFQARHLRIDYLGNRQGCAFCACAGFDCAILLWDTCREEDDPDWPANVSELRHGLRYPGPEDGGPRSRETGDT